MALHYKTEALVFRKEERLESDRVFSVFSKDFGRIEIIGKAIRKMSAKLRGNIEIFYLSEVEFIQGQSRKTLTDATVIHYFNESSKNPDKLLLSIALAKVIDHFTRDEQEDLPTFEFITDAFKTLEDEVTLSSHYFLFYYYFLWNFLSLMGYKPSLLHCASCNQKLNPYG